MMNKLTSCDRYKIGFFGLLVLLVGVFGFIASSSLTNFSYKNKAFVNTLKMVPLEKEEGSTDGNVGTGQPDLNKGGAIATISTFTKVGDQVDAYNVSFKEVEFKPIDEGKGTGGEMIVLNAKATRGLSEQSEALKPTEEQKPESLLKPCTSGIYTGGKITKLVEGESNQTQEIEGGDVTTSQIIEPEIEEIMIDEIFLKQGFQNHTYRIEYKFISPSPTTPAGQEKTCEITIIEMQLDPPLTPSPTSTE